MKVNCYIVNRESWGVKRENTANNLVEAPSLWRRPALKREIDEELRLHLEQRTAENRAACPRYIHETFDR